MNTQDNKRYDAHTYHSVGTPHTQDRLIYQKEINLEFKYQMDILKLYNLQCKKK